MIDLGLGQNGDLEIVNFDLILVFDVDQIAQNLAIRLRFFLGEWFLNTLVGVPYYQYFFIKEPNQIQIETFLKQEIVDTNGVIQINNFATEYSDRERSYKVFFSVQTQSTELTLDLEIP